MKEQLRNELEILMSNQLTAWELAFYRVYLAFSRSITETAFSLGMTERNAYKMLDNIGRKLSVQVNIGKDNHA